MLEIVIKSDNGKRSAFRESDSSFHYLEKDVTLQLEHSLISLRKWEQKWHKPFLGRENKPTELTSEELFDYIKCMTIKKVPDDVYYFLTEEDFKKIIDYIKDPMTATWFNKQQEQANSKMSSRSVTAELIYCWMVMLNIPVEECQTWHLNTLLTLIKVVSLEQQPPKKMSRQAAAAERARLNAERRAKYNTKG